MMLRTTREIGMAMRCLREQAGLSQEVLTGQAGVSRRWRLRLENGIPTAEMSFVLDCLGSLGAGVEVFDKTGIPWKI